MASENSPLQIYALQAELCKCLADSKRLMIIHELRSGEKSVSELSASLAMKQSNTSKHLAVLRKAGVVLARREGNTVYYTLASDRIGQACDLVREVIGAQLQRGRALAEDLFDQQQDG